MSKKDNSYFEPLTGKIKRRKFVVCDLETKDGPTQKAGFTRPFMGGVYDGKRFDAFFNMGRGGDWDEAWFQPGGCVDRMMRHLLQRKYSGCHIYAHNAGRFDYLFLLPWLMHTGERLGFRFTLIPVASSIQVLDVWHGDNRWRRWRFLDSLRLIPISLNQAAKTFGLPGKLEHDLHLPENDPAWREYNRVDCVELYKVLERFHHYIENVLCGEVGITAPATAVKLLRRKYLKEPINRNVHTHEFIRRGYCGGRVEVFKAEGRNIRYYDINSSYPAAMLEDMPGSVCTAWDGKPPSRFLNGRIGFCEVNVYVPPMHIPPLPVRGDGKHLPRGKLLFPTGRLTGVWEWGELQQALSMGCTIHSWGRSYWYEPVPLFGQYCRDLYSYRDKSHPNYDEGLASVTKNLLNSTYGKFGMKTLRRKLYRFDDPELPECAVPADQDPECLIWVAEEEVDAGYVMPQVAARVTAIARVALLKHMLHAVELGGEVHYCDTDSLLPDVDMPTTSELGGLKDEFPEHSGRLYGKFLGPKMYMLSSEAFEDSPPFELVKAKGMQLKRAHKAEEKAEAARYNREMFESLAAGNAVIMQRLEKVGTLARDGFRRGPRMITVPKRLRLDSGKRNILPDGSTTPFDVSMW